MAAIIQFWKPINDLNVDNSGLWHSFLLYQNDSGQFLQIARGGPQSAQAGVLGLSTDGVNLGAGLGNIVTYVGPYNQNNTNLGSQDFFYPSQLSTLPQNVVLSGDSATVQAAWNNISTLSQAINSGNIPYLPTENSNSFADTAVQYIGASNVDSGITSGHY